MILNITKAQYLEEFKIKILFNDDIASEYLHDWR
jgi:hypothetical protein